MAEDYEGGVELVKGRRPPAQAPKRQAPRQLTPQQEEEMNRRRYENNPQYYNWTRPGLRSAKKGGLIRVDGAAIRGRTRGKVT